MKRTIVFLLMIALACGAMAQEKASRYGIKSGIAQVKSINEGNVSTGVQSFDDYGALEAYTSSAMTAFGRIETTTILKDGKSWMVWPGKKPKEFDNPMAEISFVNLTDAIVDKYKVKEIGQEEFLGRMCTKYTYEIKQGPVRSNYTAWVYKGFTLKLITKVGRREVVFEVTDFQEDVPVSSEVFNLPK